VKSGTRVFIRLLGVLVLGWVICVVGVLMWGRRDATRPADAIVVLGAAQYAGRPSPVLRSRLDHAYDLWKREMAPRLILTGGQGEGDTISEAEVGQRYLMRLGVPRKSIMLETRGRSTDESLVAVAALVREAELGDVILVSDPFHMLRLQLISWRLGVKASCSPTRTSPIAASPAETAQHVLGESVKVPASLLLSALRGWRSGA
jgi:uncharacterized SAM-binding protein YcdF (DUF218 family)